jgi:hypothetical protein
MKMTLSLMAASAVLLAGCASTDAPGTAQTAPAELVYRTGSNIPVRNATPQTPEEKQRQAEESQRTMQQMQRTGAGTPKL